MLIAKSLTKLYGVVIGVNDVTLEVAPGVVGLLGPNGAGKSTLLKLITGQLKPTEGSIEVLGQRPWGNPAIFRELGFCPEQDSFYDNLTAHQFVLSLARMSGLGAEAERRTVLALERVGATPFKDRPIASYSKGMRQRTKIAQALVHDPKLLILDEPLTGTDPVGRREIMDLVIDLGREGRSVLVSSHVLHEVQAVTDRFILLFGGRVLASGGIREIRELLDEHPHTITLRCTEERALAREIVNRLSITGLAIEGEASLTISTRAPREFYSGLPGAAVAAGATILEMVSKDDELESVFQYLTSGEA